MLVQQHTGQTDMCFIHRKFMYYVWRIYKRRQIIKNLSCTVFYKVSPTTHKTVILLRESGADLLPPQITHTQVSLWRTEIQPQWGQREGVKHKGKIGSCPVRTTYAGTDPVLTAGVNGLRETQASLCSPLLKLCCFCSREEEKDPHVHYSTMMSWSQLHPCVLLLLPVVYSEAAQPDIGRLWSQLHDVPPVSEACNCTPALRRQPKTAGPPWLYTKRTADKTQGWEVPLLQICHCLSLTPPHLWTWTQHTRRTTTTDATS